jgi:hypothetical protein
MDDPCAPHPILHHHIIGRITKSRHQGLHHLKHALAISDKCYKMGAAPLAAVVATPLSALAFAKKLAIIGGLLSVGGAGVGGGVWLTGGIREIIKKHHHMHTIPVVVVPEPSSIYVLLFAITLLLLIQGGVIWRQI